MMSLIIVILLEIKVAAPLVTIKKHECEATIRILLGICDDLLFRKGLKPFLLRAI